VTKNFGVMDIIKCRFFYALHIKREAARLNDVQLTIKTNTSANYSSNIACNVGLEEGNLRHKEILGFKF
jgi:hypothetical protein